jgi:sugar phosphate isomerase/epimerase
LSKPFGLQLYSIRDEMDKDYMGTLRRVAGMGYKQVEFAGFADYSAGEIKAALTDLGLDGISAHVGADRLTGEQLHPQLEYLAEIGCRYVILPWYEVSTMEKVREVCDILNGAAEAARQYGLICGYHNHGHEFTRLGEEFALTHIMKNTSPDVVIELDVFWAAHADVNPFDYFERHQDRIRMLHLKQIDAEKNSVDLPDGMIDMADLSRMARRFGVDTFIVEQEAYPVSSMESARVNAEYLKKIL